MDIKRKKAMMNLRHMKNSSIKEVPDEKIIKMNVTLSVLELNGILLKEKFNMNDYKVIPNMKSTSVVLSLVQSDDGDFIINRFEPQPLTKPIYMTKHHYFYYGVQWEGSTKSYPISMKTTYPNKYETKNFYLFINLVHDKQIIPLCIAHIPINNEIEQTKEMNVNLLNIGTKQKWFHVQKLIQQVKVGLARDTKSQSDVASASASASASSSLDSKYDFKVDKKAYLKVSVQVTKSAPSPPPPPPPPPIKPKWSVEYHLSNPTNDTPPVMKSEKQIKDMDTTKLNPTKNETFVSQCINSLLCCHSMKYNEEEQQQLLYPMESLTTLDTFTYTNNDESCSTGEITPLSVLDHHSLGEETFDSVTQARKVIREYAKINGESPHDFVSYKKD